LRTARRVKSLVAASQARNRLESDLDAMYDIDSQPSKKPRLSTSQDKENYGIHHGQSPFKLTKGSGTSRRNVLYKAPSGTDEKALMENLMAGIDASVFENYEVSSPVKPSQVRTPATRKDVRQISSRLEQQGIPKRHVLAKSRPIGTLLVKMEGSRNDANVVRKTAVTQELPDGTEDTKPKLEEDLPTEVKRDHALMKGVKRECGSMKLSKLENGLAPPRAEGTSPAQKTDNDNMEDKFGALDDELFEFNFDLADFAAFDDDLVTKAEPEVRIATFGGI
jgi:hypothetical protein